MQDLTGAEKKFSNELYLCQNILRGMGAPLFTATFVHETQLELDFTWMTHCKFWNTGLKLRRLTIPLVHCKSDGTLTFQV
jgi:hypothetical protein